MDLALTIVLGAAVMTVAVITLRRLYKTLFSVYLYKRKAKQLGGGNLRRLKEQIRRNQLPPIPIGYDSILLIFYIYRHVVFFSFKSAYKDGRSKVRSRSIL
jgi:hypothetical protein